MPRQPGAWMPTAEYTVRLDAFEGPLDLLLFLIRRAEVEVGDIPIAQITEQYLKHIEDLADPVHGGVGGRLDIERAGEFLVMAATLMEIKSRMLAPPVVVEGAEGTDAGVDPRAAKRDEPLDPRAELVKQLLEYKRFRDAGDRLNQFKKDWEGMYPSGRALAAKPEADEAPADQPEATGPVDLDDIELIDLVEAFSRIIETVDLTRVGEHRVAMDDTPIELHAEDIVDRLKRHAEEALASGLTGGIGGAGEMDFVSVFENRSRSEMIGLFLAVLELVKQQRIWVRQVDEDRTGRRIVLKLADVPVQAGVSTSPSPAATAESAAPIPEDH